MEKVTFLIGSIVNTSSGVGVDILLAVDQASILGEKWFTIARTLCRLDSNSLQASLWVLPGYYRNKKVCHNQICRRIVVTNN